MSTKTGPSHFAKPNSETIRGGTDLSDVYNADGLVKGLLALRGIES